MQRFGFAAKFTDEQGKEVAIMSYTIAATTLDSATEQAHQEATADLRKVHKPQANGYELQHLSTGPYTPKCYTHYEAKKTVESLKERIQQYDDGLIDLDEFISCLYCEANQAYAAREEYLRHGLAILGAATK